MITVFTETKSPRLRYTLEILFRRCLGIDFRLITDWDKFRKIDLPRINYSKREHKDSLQIIPHALLFEDSIHSQKIKVKKWNGLPVFFQTNDKGEFPFDALAASFYLLSRYEEYLDYQPDEHGRFPAKASLAYREGFLERPIVNEWAMEIVRLLARSFPDYTFHQTEFRYVSTIDIDMAYSYKHKGVWRNLGGFTRELLKLDLKKLDKRIKVLTDKEQDPLDNFEYQLSQHRKWETEVIYFILLADHSKFDKNIEWDNESFVELIQELAEEYTVGIHPSYYSNKVRKKLAEEIERLESITMKEVDCSRQHFLKLDIRETYKLLEARGILHDHSMGYSEETGFRAGTCSSFPFFDLLKNERRELILHPFAVMDVALNRFKKLNPAQATEKIRELMGRVKKCRGTFISVFHNESLSDFDNWKGWREVYENMLAEAVKVYDPLPA